jgi:hypothetical protein
MKGLDWRCPICGARWTLAQPTARALQMIVDLTVQHLEEHRKHNTTVDSAAGAPIPPNRTWSR